MALEKIKYRGSELYSPKYDRVFKAMFTDGDLTLLANFLTHVLSMDITADGIRIENSEQHSQSKDNKLIRLDLVVMLKDKTVVNVEMQVENEAGIGKRSVFNAAKLMGKQLDTGENYDKLCPVITINILDFKLFDNPKVYHNRYRMKNIETGKEMPDANVFEVSFIELPKLPKKNDGNKKELWLKFLSAKTEEELNMLVTQDPIFETAVDTLVKVNADRDLWVYMYQQEKIERDIASNLEAREEKGIKKGILQVAKNLKNMGRSSTEIVEATGLTIKQIEVL